MNPNPVLKKLGFAPTDRVAIIHADDIGMCHASIAAWEELDAFGLVSCGAVMVPCPWFPEAARYAREHPETDLGVHITLTSEWTTYRWDPLSTQDSACGFIDEEGFFPRSAEAVQEKGDPEAVDAEMEAQIQRAKAFGMKPSHADTHMGTVAHMKFMMSYIQLAIRHQVPPMMLRLDEVGWRRINQEHGGAALSEEAIHMATQMIASLEDMGVPLLDHIHGMPLDSDPALRMEHTKAAFDRLEPGITHFIIHPSKDTPELRAITPDWRCRVADYETFLKEELRQHLKNTGVQVIGYKQIQAVMPKSG